MHELSHAVRAFKGIDNKIHYIPDTEAVMKISDEAWSAIENAYADQDIDVSRAELIADEASAWYAEEMLGKDGVVDLLMGKKPSLKNKILNFFKGASKDYEGDVKLSREAKKQYKSFKQMFDAFSALNQGANAYGGNAESESRYSHDIDYAGFNKPITEKDRKNLRTIEKKSINKFTHDDLVKTRKWAYRYFTDKNIGVKSPFFRAWFGEWRVYDKKTAAETVDIPQGVKIDTSNRKIINRDTKWQVQITEDTIQDSLHYAQKDRLYIQRILSHIDEIIEKAIFLDTQISEKNSSNKKGSSEFMHYLYAIVEFQGAPFMAKITVEEYDAGTSHRAYNAQRIKMSALSRAQYSQLKTAYRGKYASSVDAISVSDLINLVKTYDDKFTPAPEISPQAAKLLLNEDGTPKVFYHGTKTENGEFWEFDYNKAKKKGGLGFKSFGLGNYFTSNKLDGTELYGSRVIDAYLSIQNPFVVKRGENFKKKVGDVLGINTEQMSYNQIQAEMRNAGYDGVIALNENGEAAIAVTFHSKQIKSASNNIGTFDKDSADIRYSLDTDYLSAVENGDEKTQERIIKEAAKKSGYTVKAYHGTPNGSGFTVFKGDVFLAEDRYTAETYSALGGKVYDVFLNPKGFLVIEGNHSSNRKIKYPEVLNKHLEFQTEYKNGFASTREIAQAAKEAGFRGVEFRDIGDYGLSGLKWETDERGFNQAITPDDTTVYVVFDSNQIKSADLITYDDNGNIIPPSERFNTENKDIRYSLDLGIGEAFPNGTRVKANDRGNVGVITGYDKTTDSYSVRFTSKEGLTATLQMTENDFVPISRKAKKKAIGSKSSDTESGEVEIETKALTEMPDKYKASVKEKISNAWTSVQISLTNEQAGIEKIGKKLGIKDIEARVQAVRASRNMAEMMLGDEQYRIGASGKDTIRG